MRDFLSKSLARQLNAAILPVIVLTLFSLAAIQIFVTYRNTMEQLQQKAYNTLHLAQISLIEPIWNLNQESIDDIRDSIMLDQDIVAIRITDELGNVLSQIKRPGYRHYDFKALQTDRSFLYQTIDVTYIDELVGRVHMVTTNELAMSEVKSRTVFTLIVTALVVLLLGAIISYFGIRFIKRPVNELKTKAITLANGNLNIDIELSRKDELGILAKSFADMREAIQKKIEELQYLNDHLELLVEDRTNELSEALKSVKESKMAADSANLAKTEFLANMSHELRTPMHGILGFAKLGLSRTENTPIEKTSSFFNVIYENGQRLLGLLNDLLDLSKLELKKESYHFQREEFAPLVQMVINEFETIANERNISVELLPDTPPRNCLWRCRQAHAGDSKSAFQCHQVFREWESSDNPDWKRYPIHASFGYR